MEILQEKLLALIRDKCSSHWEPVIYRDHIIINLPETAEHYRSAYNTVKKEVINCATEHLPERDTEILIEVRNGAWNCSFKLAKTASKES